MKFSSSILLVLIIATGLAVRLYRIDQPLLEFFPPRQTQTAEITRNIYVNGWQDFWIPKVRYFTPREDSGQAGEPLPFVFEFPLYNGIVAVFYHTTDSTVIWGRIVSLTFFIGSSVVFYKILRSTALVHSPRITNNHLRMTQYALLFFVFSPLHILVSRSFQPDELTLFLLLLSIYRSSWILFGLTVLVKLPVILFFPMLFSSARLAGVSFSRSLLRLSLALSPAAWWYWRASRLAVTALAGGAYQAENWFQLSLLWNPNWYWSLFQIETVWLFTATGFFVFLIGVWTTTNSLWRSWVVSGLLYLSVFNKHAMTHEYYHVYLVPLAAVLVGAGLERLHTLFVQPPTWRRMSGRVVITLLFVLGLLAPAWRRISSAPRIPEDSTEVSVDRYRLIEDFDVDHSDAP